MKSAHHPFRIIDTAEAGNVGGARFPTHELTTMALGEEGGNGGYVTLAYNEDGGAYTLAIGEDGTQQFS